MTNLYYGPVVNPQTLNNYLALPRCLIAVGPDGNIIWIENDLDLSAVHDAAVKHGLKQGEYTLVELSSKSPEFIMPGLIDTHVHACQFPANGLGGDRELLDWLLETVFPTEAKFKDDEYAKRAYNDVVDRSIASGTTTSCYYGSLHLDATMTLAEIVQKKGQRAFVGKCSMDWNCPGYYIEPSAEASLKDTIKLIEHIQNLPASYAGERLVHPIITPRFALSCSENLLTELGKLAESLPHVSIQTHISENRKEVEDTKQRFNADSYAEVYDRFGLLRNNTILGHGVWLTENEMELIARRGAAVAHCPSSNFFLGSGMARVGLLLDHGVKVGLGSDVSGGNNPSILYTVQMASTASKMVSIQAELDEERRQHRHKHMCGKHGGHGRHGKHGKHCGHEEDIHDQSKNEGGSNENKDEDDDDNEEDEETCHGKHHGRCEHRESHAHGHHHHHRHCHGSRPGTFANKKLQVETLLYLATLGGAHVCCLQDRVGSFAVGKAFDALHVSLDDACGNPAVWGKGLDDGEMVREEKNVRRWLERFLFGGDNRNVRQVFVQGVAVGGADVQK